MQRKYSSATNNQKVKNICKKNCPRKTIKYKLPLTWSNKLARWQCSAGQHDNKIKINQINCSCIEGKKLVNPIKAKSNPES